LVFLFVFSAELIRAGLTHPLWREFEWANLSVRFLNDVQLETVCELLKRSGGLSPPIKLLKGCSVASEFYPETHPRVICDLGVFVDAKDQTILESLLFEMGFRQKSKNGARTISLITIVYRSITREMEFGWKYIKDSSASE
jgi:hypothetical protein